MELLLNGKCSNFLETVHSSLYTEPINHVRSNTAIDKHFSHNLWRQDLGKNCHDPSVLVHRPFQLFTIGVCIIDW